MHPHRTAGYGARALTRRPDPTTSASVEPQLLDMRGRRLAKSCRPGHRAGQPSPLKGRRFEPYAPSVEQLVQFLRAIPQNTPEGRRLRALILVGWRSGLRIFELLALHESDLNRDDYAITVRRGKGGKRRVSAMDEWAWHQLGPWLAERQQWPVGPLFCVLNGPTAGRRAMRPGYVRAEFAKTQQRAGIRLRIHPHALRHAHAVELWREGVDVYTISRQLGHANIAITATYLQSLAPLELLEPIGRRRPPVMAVHDLTLTA